MSWKIIFFLLLFWAKDFKNGSKQSFRIITTFYGEVWNLYSMKKSHSEVLMMPLSIIIIMLMFEPAPPENNAWYSPKSNFNE